MYKNGQQNFYTADILTHYSKKSTAGTYNIDGGCIQVSQ